MSGMDRQAQIEYIFDHYQHPRNRGEMADADVHVQGGHEGCADIVTMYLKFDGERIADVSFTGEGCTISQASASVMTELVKGLSASEIEQMDYHVIEDELGEEVVRTRPRCATLSLDTLKAAVKEFRNRQMRAKAKR
jgi:nitrogen fixation NifU-like protein